MPAHFLTLEPVGALPVPDYTSEALTRLSRFELTQRIQTDFWKRFKREYLQTLQQRGKWFDPAIPPELGSLVLINDGNVPPCEWKMGRILALYPGDDNVARVATVKTSSGELKRPLVKLCPLPPCCH
ncbi:hypothetical protein JTB14_007245 [Gonioctena quinquepunctata]|nr:hypothetical protein JTB14_007245 [Gonioctena quinquepunctata]